jgi:hypothetical protein
MVRHFSLGSSPDVTFLESIESFVAEQLRTSEAPQQHASLLDWTFASLKVIPETETWDQSHDRS